MSSECAATQLGAIHTRPPGCQLSLTPRLAYRSTLMWSAHTVLNTACVLCHALLLLGNRRSSKVCYSTALSLLSKKCCLVFLWFSHVAIVSYFILLVLLHILGCWTCHFIHLDMKLFYSNLCVCVFKQVSTVTMSALRASGGQTALWPAHARMEAPAPLRTAPVCALRATVAHPAKDVSIPFNISLIKLLKQERVMLINVDSIPCGVKWLSQRESEKSST